MEGLPCFYHVGFTWHFSIVLGTQILNRHGCWAGIFFAVVPRDSALIGLIGLVEDIKSGIITLRAFAQVALCLLGLSLFPEVVPTSIGVFFEIFDGLNSFLFLLLGTLITIVGFANAGNMADGANGLLAISSLPLIYVLYQLSLDLYFWALFLSVFIFATYNIATGKNISGRLRRVCFS